MLIALMLSCSHPTVPAAPASASTSGEAPALQLQPAPQEDRRRRAVAEELRQGRPTPIRSDLSDAPELAAHIMAAAEAIDALHLAQTGGAAWADQLGPDSASQEVFRRNHGPWCLAAKTQSDPSCNAVPSLPPHYVGVYPQDVQLRQGFCDDLQQQGLMDPFQVVVHGAEGLQSTPYSQAWPEHTAKIAQELRAAADTLGPDEAHFAAYLRAAAQAFGDNDWFAADRVWAEMNADNSRWYLRVGPDETYWEPCNRKAGFHLVWARTNQSSKQWQAKLEPLKGEMERALAALAAPYPPRQVGFDLPEFIDIIVNAGDSRQPLGATIGQSLPNWGPVAEAGGRTVAMTNLFTDPASMDASKTQQASVFCADSLSWRTDDPQPMLMTTVLHEAAHNLGPAAGYTIGGKTDEDLFGGSLSSLLEELKAQTASLYFTDWLLAREVISADFAAQAHFADLAWAVGKVGGGLVDGRGGIKPYGQLSAIQLGTLLDHGALSWQADQLAANGTDSGCLSIDESKLPAAIDALAHEVLRVKGQGDVAGARALQAKYAGPDAVYADVWQELSARWLRVASPSFTYDVRF